MSRLVGSETQALDDRATVSGIPRVMREVHAGLARALPPVDAELVPVHTRVVAGAEPTRPREEYLASDPVFRNPLHAVEDLDVLLILGLNMQTDFARVLRTRRERILPTVSLVYDILPILNPEWFLPRAREYYRAYLQQLLHVSDHVVVNSEEVARGLRALGWRIPGEIHVMPLGSCFPQQPPSPAPDTPLRLMYVSSVAPRKGHGLLLQAFDLLRSRDVPVELTLIGRAGWQDDIVEAVLAHPELGRSLHWLRDADDVTVLDTARHSRVAVVPAEDEGYGLFLDEAVTLGLTTVARDIPVLRERDYPNLLFAEGTAEAFADAIVAAGASRPEPVTPGTVRTMSAFAQDVSDLVISLLP